VSEASVAVDHVFICTPVGGPAADQLVQFGLREGAPNRHPGQGTACRRFFFRNAMLELLWVEDAAQAQSEQTRRTKLWERWSAGGRGVSPFGIILRPATHSESAIPFPAWDYRPKYLPDSVLQIASDAQPAEPMWCYLEAGRRPDDAPPERRQPLEHPAGFREVTRVRIFGPPLGGAAVTAAMARAGVVLWQAAAEHRLELEFDGDQRGNRVSFHPDLPLAFRW
jgi:hypothetical protein